ncbi:VOC family protein [Paenibacillus gansuensis]|uniref:VOC family protein n=1 Tax=Paenibacillus gansuensis TaxID=306542 RepID=A0ABW5P9M0_9BACL
MRGRLTLNVPIDHVGIVGRNVVEMREALGRLGFYSPGVTSLALGDDSGRQPSRNSHFVFDAGYIELIASQGDDHLARYVSRREGLHILAMASGNAQASREAFQRLSLQPAGTLVSTRPAVHGEVTGTASFEWFGFAEPSFPEGLVCVVEHLTPELIYQKERFQHPNGAFRLDEVILLVDDTDQAAERYGSLSFAHCNVNPLQNHVTWCGRLTLLDEARSRERFSGLETDIRNGFLGFIVAVKSMPQVHHMLQKSGIPYQTSADGVVWVQPETAAGSLVGFRESIE